MFDLLWRWLRLLIITILWAIPISILVVIGYILFGYVLPEILPETHILFLNDLYAQLLGIVLTVGIVDRLSVHRAERTLIADLLIEASSPSRDFALHALARLRAKRWLVGRRGRLQRAQFSNAHWRGANLYKANLFRVWLYNADLAQAELSWANLCRATLRFADLQEAQLGGADLRGADLLGANLQNAKFNETITRLDQDTVLPDGSNYDVTLGMRQLERFTTPEHIKFWRSNNKLSQAYQPKGT